MTAPAHQADLTGKRFGRLRVIMRAGSSPHGDALWKCECGCGTACEIRASSLRGNVTRSCGCLRSDKMRRRGLSRIRHDVRDDYDTDIL